MYAAGSLAPTLSNIALFSESQGEIPIMFLGGGARSGVSQVVSCHTGRTRTSLTRVSNSFTSTRRSHTFYTQPFVDIMKYTAGTFAQM